ncbi:DNA cytosine methyltransferase [Dactylococcopsis salina]|uniref:DNA (cytosine-5-)-methyltransferase n=1 Tax=Dactylococcopsis salina (strain PCC 8305) TaxID=13035 RepID=K9YXG2_DACS8|nr:DNA cytosine methyltransferase [Dactylococcopsis salina]AFZ51025.1 DNA-methyltransferase Dcm [Dactylococcopsis salina PCC 8305]
MQIVSLFSGCGGLDLGFRQAGFQVVWANEYDRTIWSTYQRNHQNTILDQRDIKEITSQDIPDCVGIIGGPPCQSWSEGGKQRGINDDRGRLFLEYIRVLKDKQPDFFLAENVSGILHSKHQESFQQIFDSFRKAGYNVAYKLLNAKFYNVPQDRIRVIFVGYHHRLGKKFDFGKLTPQNNIPTLKDAIWNLRLSAIPAKEKNKTRGNECLIPNHEYMIGGFSSIYMSRNRVRNWTEPSFTIQAGGRHAPIHPQANKMIKVEKDKFVFDENSLENYRRLSVRECARIQTFPDNFIFDYDYVNNGYKMVGNAVPVNFARAIAQIIYYDLLNQTIPVDLNQRQSEPIQLTLPVG